MGERTGSVISHSLEVLDVYVGPGLLLCAGIVFAVVTFTATLPKAADLSEVRGRLDSYYFNQWGRGHDDYHTVLILEDGSRFRADALNKETATTLLKERGVEVRFYVEPHATDLSKDGAVKSYGLWVDGQEVESLDQALGHEKFIVRFCFPALGIFATAAALLICRRNRARYAE